MKFTASNAVLAAVIVGAAIAAPAFVYPIFLMKVLCFAMFACAVNLLIGYIGLLSFGHSMFFGVSAYMVAHAVKTWGWSPEMSLIFATMASAALGLVAGVIAIRRQGIYFAMTTLALAQMVYFFCIQAPFTGSEDGIQNIPRGALLGLIDISSDLSLYALVVLIFGVTFFAYYRTINSPFGQVLKAVRDNESRAISLGYKVNRYKLLAFVLSAAMAGLAGGTKVLVFQLASLTDVSWHMSIEVVLMVLVGGLGTLAGPVVGAAVVLTMQEHLAFLGEWVMVIQGVIFVIVVMLFRRGVVGEFNGWRAIRKGARSRRREPPPRTVIAPPESN